MTLGAVTGILVTISANDGFLQAAQATRVVHLMYLWVGSSLVVNTAVTTLIAGRLYVVGRKSSKILAGGRSGLTNPYKGVMFVLIESGALWVSRLVPRSSSSTH